MNKLLAAAATVFFLKFAMSLAEFVQPKYKGLQ
jgi:hypothetical protein